MRREGEIKVAKEVPRTSQPKAGVRRLGMTSSKLAANKVSRVKMANIPADEKFESFNSVILAPITLYYVDRKAIAQPKTS
jgi:hypothetical protein